ncbi:MAG: adenylate kinase family protein [Candidatus Nanohaloarchaea archaeon]
MIIAVTGTPGTGKTTVAEALAEELGYEHVDVNAVAEQDRVATGEDAERGATAVDVDSLVDALHDVVGADAVLDGHLAHHFPADLTVVLRCAPHELRARLRDRGWSEEKVEENVEAEALDLVLQAAVAERDRVVELDTTGEEPADVVDAVLEAVRADDIPGALRPGHIDWDVVENVDETGHGTV